MTHDCTGNPCVICFPAKFVFPQDEPNQYFPDKFQRHGGMELRDYFAAHAMTALIAISSGQTMDGALDGAAGLCFKIADKMIKARGQHAEQANG